MQIKIIPLLQNWKVAINTVFFSFFLFYYTASWNNAMIKATVSQPLYQGDVGYGATVNSPSFSSLYILQLSNKKAFSEDWWQFGIYWIPVDKNTLNEVLEITVFCVFNNPGNCCLVLTKPACCARSHLPVQMCALGGSVLVLAAHGSPLQGENSGQCKGQCKVLAGPWELMACAAPGLAWQGSAPAAPAPWPGEHHVWLDAVFFSASNVWHFQG